MPPALARKDFEDVDVPFPDDDFEGLQKPLPLALPHKPTHRLATAHGFSLHADTAVHGNDRHGLERLCRYGARGPVAESRLRKLDDGRYEYSPKKGVAFTLTAEALVKRLVAGRMRPWVHGAVGPFRMTKRPTSFASSAKARPPNSSSSRRSHG